MKLEIGCGNGINRIPENYPTEKSWLEVNGDYDTIAIDIDQNAIHQAEENISNGTCFLVMDARKTVFRNCAIDQVIHEQGVLHHIKNYQEVLIEISRIAKEGCRIELMETVDNFPLYALARRAVGKWNGCSIESYFKTKELLKEVSRYFAIQNVQYYYQPLWIDIIGFLYKGQLPFWNWIMKYRFFISKVFYWLKLEKFFCCHVVITAYKLNKY